MAVVKCKECGHEVSTKAGKCPNCGAPVKGKGMGFGTAILIIIGVIIVAGQLGNLHEKIPTFKNSKTSSSSYCSQQRTESSKTENAKEYIQIAQATEIIQDEKTALLNSTYYGDFRIAKKIKKTGKAVLEIWRDRAKHIQRGLGVSPEIYELTLEYDEIWERKVDDFLSEEEKRKSWNDLDIAKIYWKDNKAQAYTLEKKFVSNPLTGKKLSAPSYKLTYIDDRSLILKNLSQ